MKLLTSGAEPREEGGAESVQQQDQDDPSCCMRDHLIVGRCDARGRHDAEDRGTATIRPLKVFSDSDDTESPSCETFGSRLNDDEKSNPQSTRRRSHCVQMEPGTHGQPPACAETSMSCIDDLYFQQKEIELSVLSTVTAATIGLKLLAAAKRTSRRNRSYRHRRLYPAIKCRQKRIVDAGDAGYVDEDDEADRSRVCRGSMSTYSRS